MNIRHNVLAATAALCSIAIVGCAIDPPRGGAGAAHDAPSTRPAVKTDDSASTGFSLTVYSTADPAIFSPQEALQQQAAYGQSGGGYVVPGYGVVRETRRVSLAAGTSRMEFTDVAAGIDPTTVSFRSLTAPDSTNVLEQNFEYDLTGSDKLLAKFLDKQVVIVLRQQDAAGTKRPDAAPQVLRGKLLSFESNGYVQSYVVQTESGREPIVIQRGDTIDSIHLADTAAGFVSKPTLNWTVQTDHPGMHDVQVTYQTDGLTWRADYNVVLASDDKSADMSAWVTLVNGSGRAYPDAKLKLIAGNVQRYEPQRNSGGGLFGGGGNEQKPGFSEKGLFEYHLYTLGRPTTLPNNSTKQIELFPPKSKIAVEKVFVYYGLSEKERNYVLAEPRMDRNFGTESNHQVDIYVRFRNSEANHLGVPLPAGKMRLYKVDEADNNREFVGEDIIAHTPKDEELMLRLGSAFDIVGERKQTNYEDDPSNITETFEIKLRNHKSEPVRVIVKENLFRWFNWEIKESSDPWTKQDSRTIHIPVDVPANGEKTVTYKVHYWW